MAVLASIISMVVEKRNVSSFRGVELVAAPQIYRACMGWREGGGARQKTHSWYRSHSLLPGWILKMGMVDVGIRFQVGLEPQNQNQTKKYIFSRLHSLHYVKQKGFDHKYLDALFGP